MPTVPLLTPDRAPTEAGTPGLNLAVPEDAFGGAVGKALSGLGTSIESASDRIWARAVDLQNLDNDTKAKQADTDYMVKAGTLFEQFKLKQGNDARDAFPDYIKSLQDTRQSIRDGLSNPMQQKMYDASSANFMGRNIIYGASHAGQQTQVAAKGASEARVETLIGNLDTSPEDPTAYQKTTSALRAEIASQGQINGWGPDEVKAHTDATISRAILTRSTALARVDPYAADALVDSATKDGSLLPQDAIKAQGTVQATGRAVKATNIANTVYAQGKGDADNPPMSFEDMKAKAIEMAKDQGKDDPLLIPHVISQLQTVYNQSRYAQRTEDQINTATINQALHAGVTDYQTFRANPQWAAAEDALVQSGKKVDIPALINNYNTARDRQDNEQHFRSLMGRSNNDVLSFLDYNAYEDKHLSQGQMDTIVARQTLLKKQVNQDPQVDRAMSWLRQANGSTMQALGVYNRNKSNPDDYDHLTGTVQDAMSLWADQHNHKQPTQKEFDEQIAPQVLQRHSTPGWFGTSVGSGTEPFYNQDTSTDEYKAHATQITKDVIARGGIEPTPEEIYRSYIRTQLLKLHPGKSPNE